MSDPTYTVVVTRSLEVEIVGRKMRVYSDAQAGSGWFGTLPVTTFGPFTSRELAEHAAVELCASADVASVEIVETTSSEAA